MSVTLWHPGTDAMFDAPDDAVAQYRQSGWLRLDERADHKARLAEREQAAKAAAGKAAPKDTSKG